MKLERKIVFAIFVVIVATAGITAYFFYKTPAVKTETEACTLEAKICPDGNGIQ